MQKPPFCNFSNIPKEISLFFQFYSLKYIEKQKIQTKPNCYNAKTWIKVFELELFKFLHAYNQLISRPHEICPTSYSNFST